jgi:hypothetical protein
MKNLTYPMRGGLACAGFVELAMVYDVRGWSCGDEETKIGRFTCPSGSEEPRR